MHKTDFPVEKVNPFHTFYSSIERKDLNGYPENGFQIDNALTREETLKGMTIWGAYFNFEEDENYSKSEIFNQPWNNPSDEVYSIKFRLKY